MNIDEVIYSLHQKSSPTYLAGMARFGINSSTALGVKVPYLRKLAKVIEVDHQMALNLWETNIHEARILATMVADAALLKPAEMDKWVSQFSSWDVCDQSCGNLFQWTPYALEKAFAYSASEREFVKRAGFVLMAAYAVHHKDKPDAFFLDFLSIIEREAWDNRNFVKKAVNWALRQIGKRNSLLRHAAIACAQRILQQDTKAAKWIARDALKELNR